MRDTEQILAVLILFSVVLIVFVISQVQHADINLRKIDEQITIGK